MSPTIKVSEELAKAVYALKRCEFRWGMYVLVTGSDKQSLLLGAAAKHAGAASVVLCAENDAQVALVKKMGLTAFLSEKEDAAQMVKDVTGKHKFDRVFETSGTEKGFNIALSAVKRGATIGVLAELPKPLELEKPSVPIRSQIRFIGVSKSDEKSTAASSDLLNTAEFAQIISELA